MAQQDRPPRSLRKGGGGPKYFRDWSQADQYIDQDDEDDFEDEPLNGPQEMQMVGDLGEDAPPAPAPRSTSETGLKPVLGELPEMKVIVPEAPPPTSSQEPEKPKPTITRVNKPTIQRARRQSEIRADEERKAKEEALRKAAEAEKAERLAKATPSILKQTKNLDAKELKSSIKEIGSKIDETRESVKSTADSLSENIKGISDRVTEKMTVQIKKLSNSLVGFLNRFGKKAQTQVANADDFEDQDFEDAPIEQSEVRAPAPPPVPASPAVETTLLDNLPRVPQVMYAELYQEGITFQTFDKQPVVTGSPTDVAAFQVEFVDNAIEDLRKCIKLVQKLPDPKEGPYAGIPMVYIFKHVSPNDINFFLHYIRSRPQSFKDKNMKLSEAFASWLIKRSHKTVITDPFPEVPPLAYFPLYKKNIRFLTLDRKQMVLATGKSPEEVDRIFMENALEDVQLCMDYVAKFGTPKEGPYKGRPLKNLFRTIEAKDIYFFLHYINANPEMFSGQNFKFSEAFASWVLTRSHETELPQ